MTARGSPRLVDYSPAPVVMLGGAAFHERFAREIQRRGHALTLLDRNPDAPCRTYADRFVQTSTHDVAACLREVEPLVDAGTRIITFATGAAGQTCVELCRSLGLPSRSPRLAQAALDKRCLSRTLVQSGLPHLPELHFHGSDLAGAKLADFDFPAILKPVGGVGGAHVARVGSPEEVLALVSRGDARQSYLLQRRIEGVERLVAMLVQGGEPVALLHGVNVFDPSTGWPWPIGVALERLPLTAPRPAWLAKLVSELLPTFELEDDFVTLELISSGAASYVIDVEVNALSPFPCSEVMEAGELTRRLVDVYLGQPIDTDATVGWVSALTFVVSADEQRLAALRSRETEEFRFEASETWARLESYGRHIFKGGYVVLKQAADLAQAASRSLAIASQLLEEV